MYKVSHFYLYTSVLIINSNDTKVSLIPERRIKINKHAKSHSILVFHIFHSMYSRYDSHIQKNIHFLNKIFIIYSFGDSNCHKFHSSITKQRILLQRSKLITSTISRHCSKFCAYFLGILTYFSGKCKNFELIIFDKE